jgi:excisionase family DNA binding protein
MHTPQSPDPIMIDALDIARAAVRLYAAEHPRPAQVTQTQAAQMLSVSRPTVSRMIRAGKLRLNACGLIPVSEIDRVLAVERVA